MDKNDNIKKTNKRSKNVKNTKNKKTVKNTQKNKQDEVLNPFSPIEILQAKEALKRLIDCMPTDEFIAFSFFLSEFIYEDEMFDDYDEMFDDDYDDYYYDENESPHDNIINFPTKDDNLPF